MTTSRYKTLVKKLANKHNLKGWQVYFDDCFFDTLAACNNRKKAMWFNEFFVTRCDYKLNKDTILHEIAHALCPNHEGHGKLWKKTCVKIGAIPQEISCWENENFTERFHGMKIPESPLSVVFPPDDKTKIIYI